MTQRWRLWPQGFEDRCEKPSVRPKAAAYSADGRYILVLGSDRVLRSWSADGFRPWPSRLIVKDAKGMCALPGARVAVWNADTLILADHRDGRLPPMSWKARHQINSVQVLPHCAMIAVKAWNPPDEGGGNTLRLLDQADAKEIWRSQDHLGPVAEVFSFRSGTVIKDLREHWWLVRCDGQGGKPGVIR
jgi:hypothetical protein